MPLEDNKTQQYCSTKLIAFGKAEPKNSPGNGEGGIFIKGYVDEFEVHILFDSGATMSLLSKQVFDQIYGNSWTDMLQEINASVRKQIQLH